MPFEEFEAHDSFTQAQNRAIYVTPKVSAPLSIIGSLIIVYRFFQLRKKDRNTYQRLLLGMSTMDVFGSTGFFLGAWTFSDDESDNIDPPFCVFQGWLLQLNSAVFFYNGVLATNFLLRICYEFKELKVLSLEIYYHMFAWFYPVVTSFIALGMSMYAEAGPWCWIRDPPYFWAQMAFFFVPLWIIMLWSVYCMVRITLKVRESDKKIQNNVRGSKRSQRTRQVSVQAILYVVAFFMTWIFGSANRVYSHVRGEPNFTLMWLHSLFVPLQGFFNFLVYLMPRYYAWREERGQGCTDACKQMFLLCFGKTSKPEENPRSESSQNQSESRNRADSSKQRDKDGRVVGGNRSKNWGKGRGAKKQEDKDAVQSQHDQALNGGVAHKQHNQDHNSSKHGDVGTIGDDEGSKTFLEGERSSRELVQPCISGVHNVLGDDDQGQDAGRDDEHVSRSPPEDDVEAQLESEGTIEQPPSTLVGTTSEQEGERRERGNENGHKYDHDHDHELENEKETETENEKEKETENEKENALVLS